VTASDCGHPVVWVGGVRSGVQPGHRQECRWDSAARKPLPPAAGSRGDRTARMPRPYPAG